MKNNIESVIRIIKQLRIVLSKKQKINAIWVFISMFICSCLELIGVSMIVPFMSVLTSPEDLRNKWYIGWVYDIKPDISTYSLMGLMCMCFALVYIVKNGFMLYSAYIQADYAASFNKDNAVRMLDSYMKRPYEFFTNTNSSVLLRGINVDVVGVYNILIDIFAMVSEMLTIVLIGCFLLCTDWLISLATLAIAFFCMLIIIFVFKKKIKHAGKQNQEASQKRGQTSLQAINGIKEITVLDRRSIFIKAFEDATEIEKKSYVTRNFMSACPDRLLEGICISGIMATMFFRIATSTDYASIISTLGVFAMGAFRVLPSFSKISARVNDAIFYLPCLQNCCDNFTEADIFDTQEINAYMGEYDSERIGLKESLEIDNISWHYSDSKKNVLQNISFSITKGESVAFVGASGAGKSTLADIIMGLYSPQEGQIKVDGVDIATIPHEWKKTIGYVPQTVFLIDASIRRNVAFGLDEKDIDDNKIWNALEKAQVREFVEKLPNGLDTIVGERGIKFSGGQRQRVAIARALYDDPDILVFDEATSALDNETEAAVMDSINSLNGYKTLIIVAHRLSTIKNCDKIYEILDGGAVLRTYDYLINR